GGGGGPGPRPPAEGRVWRESARPGRAIRGAGRWWRRWSPDDAGWRPRDWSGGHTVHSLPSTAAPARGWRRGDGGRLAARAPAPALTLAIEDLHLALVVAAARHRRCRNGVFD